MSIIKKLKHAGLWQTLQKIIQVITQFGYMAVMARLLTKADFGLMALASSFISFGILFSEAGMGTALIQRNNINQKHMNAAMQGSMAVGVFIFILFILLSEYIAVFFDQPLLSPIIKVVGIGIILSSLSSVSISLLQKNFKFKHTSLVTMLTTVIGYSAGVIAAFQGLGVWSLIIANLTSSLLNTVFLLYLAPVTFSLKIHFKEWRELFSFGSGVLLSRLISRFSSNGLNLVLGKIFHPAQLGLFERTNTIKSLPSSYLGDVLDTIMFPAMAEIQNDNDRVFKVYQHGLGVVNTLLMPLALFLIIYSKEIVLLLLGANWIDAVLPLQIMFIVLPFSSSIRMADSVIRAKGLIYKNVYRRSIYMIVLIVTASLGGHYYEVVGASIGVAFSYIFNYVYMLFLVKNIFNKSLREIFINPIQAGLKLSIVVLIPILLFTTIFNAWQHDSIIKFIVISLLVGLSMVIIAWKKPSLLGVYLHETILHLFSKKKK